jgi:hypothetical protein
MANTFSKSLIVTGKDVQPWHVTQSIDAFTGTNDYDLNLVGSFTLTGSLQISGSVIGSTLESASYSLEAENVQQVENSNYSPLAEYNLRGIFKIDFTSPITPSLQSLTAYGMGAGEILSDSGYYGITIPIEASIVSASYVSSTIGNSSNMSSSIEIMSGSTSLHTLLKKPIYKGFQHFAESIPSVAVHPYDQIWIRLTTSNYEEPTQVAHNLTLYLRPE